MVAYGALASDGRQFVRTYEKFDNKTVRRYLAELTRHFGGVLVIMDNASQHRAAAVRGSVRGNPDIRVM